jgi:hypothetical protein
MGVRMMGKGLPPGVQDGDHAALGTEVVWISADQADRLGRRLEQDVVDDRFILQGDCGNRRRHREYDVEIRHRQQLGAAVGHPLGTRQALALRTVPVATAVVGDTNQAAVIALLDMTAQRGCAADLDGGHDAALIEREPTTLRGTERIAVAAEYVRHLQRGTHAAALLGRDDLEREPIEWARRPGDQTGRDLGVAGSCLQMGVTEQDLDDPDVGAALQKMGGKTVPQRMRRHALADPRPPPRGATG